MSSPFASPPRVRRNDSASSSSALPFSAENQPRSVPNPVYESSMHHAYGSRLLSPSRSRPQSSHENASFPCSQSPLRSPSRTVRTTSGPMREFFSVGTRSPNSHSSIQDRSIPSRSSSNLASGFALASPSSQKRMRLEVNGEGRPTSAQKDAHERYNTLLQNELLGSCDQALPDPDAVDLMFHPNAENRMPSNFSDGCGADNGVSRHESARRVTEENFDVLVSPRRVFRFQSSTQPDVGMETHRPYSLTPIKKSSQAVLCATQRNIRKIPKSPFKVLDAPHLTDDFYLNLVDWSSKNVLCVGLAGCVYLWSASTCQVSKLVDLSSVLGDSNSESGRDHERMVCSLSWSGKGNHLAIGTRGGDVLVYDIVKSALLCRLTGHQHRVGVIAWNGHVITSGSRDRHIFVRDVRSPHRDASQTSSDALKLHHHKQEVCGLEWSTGASPYLASGGNDNKLLVWDIRQSTTPIAVGKHRAAIKAITWSPHQHGLIASGGGTADRTIRFWNTVSCAHPTFAEGSTHEMTAVDKMDTGSQVCNLMWSRNVNEIVSTHGYSLNQIVVWKYPTLEKLATLTGHTYRVLYLAGSPDGQTICTGAGDETLRFWNVFPSPPSSARTGIGEVNMTDLASAAKIR